MAERLSKPRQGKREEGVQDRPIDVGSRGRHI